MIQSTVDMLRAMKMTAMAAELERQTGDASYRELNTEERLSLIVNAEWNRRQNNKINRLSNAAHFAQPGATMEGIEYFEDRKLVEVEGSEQTIKCDLLIIAAGFVGCEDYIAKESKVELTQRGTVKTEPEQYKTSIPKVFTAGDMHRGQSLVVWAITEGRHCAAEMDKFLMGYTPLI